MTAAKPIGGGRARPEEISCNSAPALFYDEAALEAAIDAAHHRLCTAPDYGQKMVHWSEMVRLIEQRTPARRRFMERMRGLA